jgi:hypothetical protein
MTAAGPGTAATAASWRSTLTAPGAADWSHSPPNTASRSLRRRLSTWSGCHTVPARMDLPLPGGPMRTASAPAVSSRSLASEGAEGSGPGERSAADGCCEPHGLRVTEPGSELLATPSAVTEVDVKAFAVLLPGAATWLGPSTPGTACRPRGRRTDGRRRTRRRATSQVRWSSITPTTSWTATHHRPGRASDRGSQPSSRGTGIGRGSTCTGCLASGVSRPRAHPGGNPCVTLRLWSTDST